MKIGLAILMIALSVLQGSAVTFETATFATRMSGLLIAPAGFLYKNSAAGLKGYTDTMDLLVAHDVNLFGFAADWKDLEPSAGTFNLQDSFKNPLTQLVPKYSQLRGVVFVLKMIDTNWRPMPADISDSPFDSPEVLTRFDALIDAMAAEASSRRITHLLLGNEVDSYLSQHPSEIRAFAIFYKRAVDRIHQKMPSVKVSTIITFDGLSRPVVLDTLAPISDFVTYTYYPFQQQSRSMHWQMRPVSEIKADMDLMAQHAGDKPFAFTEIGYSSSPTNGSSEEQQAAFVHELFRVIQAYQRNGRLAFLLYHALYDYPPDFCAPYARAQGVDPDAICGFIESLGLRHYSTGDPRKAWDEFVQGIKALK